mmetsp:Transcript_78779/g.234773  ORF Transcript_78779/g.234773 Transcript_78779/m.234773 type:complete len:205 (-) Transcript_78779:1466-2080(-)
MARRSGTSWARSWRTAGSTGCRTSATTSSTGAWRCCRRGLQPGRFRRANPALTPRWPAGPCLVHRWTSSSGSCSASSAWSCVGTPVLDWSSRTRPPMRCGPTSRRSSHPTWATRSAGSPITRCWACTSSFSLSPCTAGRAGATANASSPCLSSGHTASVTSSPRRNCPSCSKPASGRTPRQPSSLAAPWRKQSSPTARRRARPS